MQSRRLSVAGSLTVEASLVFPIFFYAVMSICCFFGYMEVKGAVKAEMIELARDISAYGDIVSLVDSLEISVTEAEELAVSKMPFIDELSLGPIFRERLKDDPRITNYIKGGIKGISLSGSDIITNKDTIKIVCEYELKAPTSLFGLGGIPVRQEIEYRYFSGYKVKSLLYSEDESDEDDSETVYITENGTVYHVSLSCPSLKITPSEVSSKDVSDKRNRSGGRYYPCEKCAKGAIPDTLYITSEGDRYHYRLDCAGLKRTVTEISIDELPEDFEACKRCQKKEETDDQ